MFFQSRRSHDRKFVWTGDAVHESSVVTRRGLFAWSPGPRQSVCCTAVVRSTLYEYSWRPGAAAADRAASADRASAAAAIAAVGVCPATAAAAIATARAGYSGAARTASSADPVRPAADPADAAPIQSGARSGCSWIIAIGDLASDLRFAARVSDVSEKGSQTRTCVRQSNVDLRSH